MRSRLLLAALLTLLPPALAGAAAGGTPVREVAPGEWAGAARVVAIGDLHGSYGKLTALLRAAELVDDELTWQGGASHLVVTGDLVDRGTGGRPIMDLLRRLESESVAAGGRVHVLLGNHEAMNLMRDLRYVANDAFAHFAAEESDEERRAARESFVARRLGDGGRSGSSGGGGEAARAARAEFDRHFPPGYFARQRAFDPDGAYGGWLLSLPAAVQIDGVVYVHAGLTEEFAALGIDGINRRVSAALGVHLEARRRLEEAGLVAPWMGLGEQRAAVFAALEDRRRLTPELRTAAELFIESAERPALGSEGPLWYRGSSWEDERIERAQLERTLELLDASAMVVGHTPTSRGRITSRFHDRLYRLDHRIAESDEPLALVFEGEEVLVVGPGNRFAMRPLRELPMGTGRFSPTVPATDAELESLLAEGAVLESRELGRGSTRPRLLVLEHAGERRRALFKDVDADGDRYRHEAAAYRLDRLLGLGMVPVTVLREIDGARGSLQIWIEEAIDLETADSYDLDLFDTEAARRKLAAARLFDALIGNPDRTPSDVLGLVGGDEVFLIDHSRAFTTGTEPPPEAPDPAELVPGLVEALRALDGRKARKELGKLLDPGEMDALLARRDALLAAGSGSRLGAGSR